MAIGERESYPIWETFLYIHLHEFSLEGCRSIVVHDVLITYNEKQSHCNELSPETWVGDLMATISFLLMTLPGK